MDNLLAPFRDAVARHPDRIAIVNGDGREVRFQDLAARIKDLAAAWQASGIGPGDRVLMAQPVTADLYASLAALWWLGATVVLPEPAMGLAGLRHAVRTTRPKAFCAAGWYRALRFLLPGLWGTTLLPTAVRHKGTPAPKPEAGEIALISFTSGSTGAPKAIPRSHSFLLHQFNAVAPLLQSDRAERDLVTFPVFTLVNLAAGRTSVLPNWSMAAAARLTPLRLAHWIEAQGVTRALLSPALAETLAASPRRGALDTVFTGGGPVFPDLIARLTAAGDLRLVCVYGSTEAEPIAHLDARDISATDRSAMATGAGLLAGRPVPEIAVRIVDGEILVAGGHVNGGYLDPAQNAGSKVHAHGQVWHRTGDSGRLDADGRLWLLGRRGAEIGTPDGTLYPFALETAARQWPGVQSAALMAHGSSAVLVVQGDDRHQTEWSGRALALGIADVRVVSALPMDRRHNSKVDRATLAKRLRL